MQIVADVHERRSGVPDALTELGYDVRRRSLRTGDYRIDDLALIERKSVRDLHLSLIRGRLWPQIGRLRRAAPWRYLLIEGESLYAGPVAPEAIRGVVITIDELGIGVIRSSDAADSAAWIARIALRRRGATRQVDRPHYAQRPQRDSHGTPSERALAAADGVSTVTARILLGHFGCLTNVLLAEPDELRTVPGVGFARALAIHRLATSTSDSGASRNRRPRAT
jgi:DNA excision repair protein ERCC-4